MAVEPRSFTAGVVAGTRLWGVTMGVGEFSLGRAFNIVRGGEFDG
jgi:hypothetical protein